MVWLERHPGGFLTGLLPDLFPGILCLHYGLSGGAKETFVSMTRHRVWLDQASELNRRDSGGVRG